MTSAVRKSAFLGFTVLFLVCATWGTASALPPVQRSVLDNGLVLLVSEEHSLPFVTMSLLIKSGSKDDPAGEEGLADVTASCLLLGAAGRTLQQINEELDFMGAQMGADASQRLYDRQPQGAEEGFRARLPHLHGRRHEAHLSGRRG